MKLEEILLLKVVNLNQLKLQNYYRNQQMNILFLFVIAALTKDFYF